ncbi:hypothetical protein Tco_0588366 [Tanacetum coccineum]
MNQILGNSKEVRTLRYLSLVVPLRKVGDEAVHKELVTEWKGMLLLLLALKQSSGPRCQDTILGDVDAQTRFETTSEYSNDPPLSKVNIFGINADGHQLLLLVQVPATEGDSINTSIKGFTYFFIRFHSFKHSLNIKPNSISSLIIKIIIMSSPKLTEMHNVVTFLEKPAKSDGFTEIIDFLKASSVKMVNVVCQLQALIDKKKVIITETSIRNDLHLDDVEVFINQQLRDMSHHKKTFVNPFHIKKIFSNMKREGKDFSGRVTPLFDSMLVQATKEVGEDSIPPTDSTQIPIIDQPSTSSQPKKKQKSRRKQRKEAETAHAETEEEEHLNTPSNDPLPSGEDSMQLNDLMALCTQLQKQVLDLEKAKSDQAIEIASLKKRVSMIKKRRQRMHLNRGGVLRILMQMLSKKDEQSTKLDDSTVGEAVTTASIEDSAAPTIQVSTADIGEVTTAKIDELTLTQTLIEIKAAKPKVVTTTTTSTTTTRPKGKGVVVQEPNEFRVPQESQPSIYKDKGKAKLDAELEEEQKLARKQEE